MANPIYTDPLLYPGAIDTFYDLVDGRTDDSRIWADTINRVQRGLVSMQKRTQYTPETLTQTGSVMATWTKSHLFTADKGTPGWRHVLLFEIESDTANAYFGGNPFTASYGMLASATSWGVRNGRTVYFPVRAAVNTLRQDSRLVCAVVCVKYDRFRRGDTLEANLTILRP